MGGDGLRCAAMGIWNASSPGPIAIAGRMSEVRDRGSVF